jgi:phosphoglycolate phosphatase
MQLMFDLDGTLTDSRLGITRCIQHALTEAGVVVPPIEELTRYIGPPLPASFATLLGTSDAEQIEATIASYRRRFEDLGMFENSLYPGIAEMLVAFDAAGHEMDVVTAKPRAYALRILQHFGIAQLFRGVYGPELGARDYSKESLIREARTGASGHAGCAVVIGDRAEDVRGAKRNGLGSVAVTWGYGDRAELEAAQPDCIVGSTGELMASLRPAAATATLNQRRRADRCRTP